MRKADQRIGGWSQKFSGYGLFLPAVGKKVSSRKETGILEAKTYCSRRTRADDVSRKMGSLHRPEKKKKIKKQKNSAGLIHGGGTGEAGGKNNLTNHSRDGGVKPTAPVFDIVKSRTTKHGRN